jgi:hypothetical protein
MSLDDLMGDLGSEGSLPSYGAMGDDAQASAAPEENLKKLKEAFTEVKEMYGKPHDWFDQPNFYKAVLEGEGDIANTIHKNLTGFIKAKDAADRTAFKNRLIPLFWEMHKQIMGKITDPSLPLEKKLFLRYGVLLPQLLSAEHRKAISSIFLENRIDEAVWYCDEWVSMVASGEVNPLATDEAPIRKTDGAAAVIAKIKTQIEKLQGRQDAMLVSLQNMNLERGMLHQKFSDAASTILRQTESTRISGMMLPFDEEQKRSMSEIPALLKSLNTVGRSIQTDYESYLENADQIAQLKRELERANSGGNVIDTSMINQEAGQIHSLARMSVGRQGNHFPILAGQFFSNDLRFVATRENVVKIMTEIEAIDVNVFKREFRRQINRVPPHVILIPCYGNMGVCWEPYERHNKATSRGRIAVPLFPSDVRVAVITAIGMLRWETAKEMAAHYWMDEGLTGQYYQWFSEQKLKGDLRAHFVSNYVLWITGESEGMQKLEREVRGIFWRNMPFSQERREVLRKRGFVYEDLYKKDLNRASSAGY